jgi:hypothetical protein
MLDPMQYVYLYHPRQLGGVDWNCAYLLRGECWEYNPLLQNGDARDLLDAKFPGWNLTYY